MTSASENEMRLAATVIIARDASDGLEVLMLQRPPHGSFPGAWVFPGGKVDPEDGDARADEEGAARVAAAREAYEETELRVAADALAAQAIWSPPEFVRPQFRTWFFVAPEFAGTAVAAEAEAVDLAWVRPADVLHRHATEGLELVVPTWVTLHLLGQHATVAALIASLEDHTVEHFQTHHRDGGVFCWHGDALYDDPQGTGPGVHRLETAELPWRYTRR